MYTALVRGMDVAMENERRSISGHILLFNPDNEPRSWEGRSSNAGALAALNHVVSHLEPRHVLSPSDYTSVHRHTAESWVVECHDTMPNSLYFRVSRYCMQEEAIGKYSVSLRLASFDVELQLGNSLVLTSLLLHVSF